MQNRLNHLEGLIIGMMNNQPLRNGPLPASPVPSSSLGASLMQEIQSTNNQESSSGSRANQPEPIAKQGPSGIETTPGQVILGMNETAYVGATHWAAILEDVS